MAKNPKGNRSRNRRMFSDAEVADELLDRATSAGRNDEFGRRQAVRQLALLDPSPVNRAAERHVLARIDAAWSLGWQPRELVRQIRRTSDTPTVGLARVAIAAERGRNPASALGGHRSERSRRLTSWDGPVAEVTWRRPSPGW